MLDIILIIINIMCVIVAIFIVRATDKNTEARREQIKQIEKEQELLDKMNKRIDKIIYLQASYKQVKEGRADD